MAQSLSDTIANIRQYAVEGREIQEEQMDLDASGTEARLEKTIRELQQRVDEQEAALAESNTDLNAIAFASEDPRKKLKQLLAVTTAYKNLTSTTPYLPNKNKKESVLPALLAARNIRQTVNGTKDAIASTEEKIKRTESQLRVEEANLQDAHAITKAMKNRIERLRTHQIDRSAKTPAQLAKELIQAKRAQQETYDAKIEELTGAMNDFLNDHLSAMIAAEELGGPVVGDMVDPGEGELAAGFTRTGKTKSTKKMPSDSKRQKTIDQIWGSGKTVGDDEPMTEAEAAHDELRTLIEDLFLTLTGPGGGKAYHQLERDSAASRFLVRAKIAQFHPKNAKQMRLIDFGRELDD
ncbi:hypothetical protein BDV96DRAFT_483430 [Lophiotrema nucula]|uniref:Centromere protein Cenp-K n=1 Tax=Lophiotrema nucula TaxID=690887 RepID=A0A6A5ZUE7_9PLEO|nr:hypothetical protein BDV96DRAFT_483430 [Lophiotrema nucula]